MKVGCPCAVQGMLVGDRVVANEMGWDGLGWGGVIDWGIRGRDGNEHGGV